MSTQYIRYPTINSGSSGVSSLNALTGAVALAAGSGITITPSGNTLTIAATGGGSFTPGNLTDVGTDGIVVTGGTNAVNGSGTSIAQHVADSTHNGYLSSTDWSTFNNKFTLPSPVDILGSYTSNFWGDPSTFIGNESDADQTNQTVVLGSTDTSTAANATSNVVLLAGDNTATGATGIAGSLFLQAGSINDGSGDPGVVQIKSGAGDSSQGGSIELTSGNSNTNQGGNLTVTSGSALGGTSNAGNLAIVCGSSVGGAGGNVTVIGGSGTPNGSISLQVGSGAAIKLQDSSIGTAGHVWTSTDASGSGHWAASSGGANTTLSNLTSPTSINQNLIPSADASFNLGTTTKIWNVGFINNLQDSGAQPVINLSGRTLNYSSGSIGFDFNTLNQLTAKATKFVFQNAKLKSTGTSPTTTVDANAGGGATGSVSNATDVAGKLELVTGTITLAAGTQITVNFNTAYSLAPIVVITPNNVTAAQAAVAAYVTSTTAGFSVNFAVASTGTQTFDWFYYVIETQ